jgi:Transposase
MLRMGIDIAVRAPHQASLADEQGNLLWSGYRFRTAAADLERLWSRLLEATIPTEVTVVMEPTRNAWVPLAAWFRRQGAMAAFGRTVLTGIDQLSARTDMIAKAAMLIRASPALQARERAITARYTARLAGVFTAETGSPDDDIEAWTAASALMAIHRGLLEHIRNAVLAGSHGGQLPQDAVTQARRALARLESGLACYPANSH